MNSLDNSMAFHAAPVLLGSKCANLINVDNTDIDEYVTTFNDDFSEHGIKMIKLNCNKNKINLYIYSERLLSERLYRKKEQKLLKEYGYNDMTVKGVLEHLSLRANSGSFPHEIGIFLGYPLSDVIGFIKGRKPRLCGYWKVYSNVRKARILFSEYNRCRKELCSGIKEYGSLFEAVHACIN